MKNIDDEDLVNSDLPKFMEDNYPEDTLDELKYRIMQTEINNALKNSHGNVPKVNLKFYALIYDILVDFPPTDILCNTIMANKFLLMFIGRLRQKFIYIIRCNWRNIRLYSRFLKFKKIKSKLP